jgi:hypothetical protein
MPINCAVKVAEEFVNGTASDLFHSAQSPFPAKEYLS